MDGIADIRGGNTPVGKKYTNKRKNSPRLLEPIASCCGSGDVYELVFNETYIKYIVIREDLQHEKQVISYEIDGFDGDKWVKISARSGIDNNYIEKVNKRLTAVRLICSAFKNTPVIEEFSVY